MLQKIMATLDKMIETTSIPEKIGVVVVYIFVSFFLLEALSFVLILVPEWLWAILIFVIILVSSFLFIRSFIRAWRQSNRDVE